MEHDLALRQERMYATFSWNLLMAGLVAAPTGMLLDLFDVRGGMASGPVLSDTGLT